jgi:signal transduction histidine kinase
MMYRCNKKGGKHHFFLSQVHYRSGKRKTRMERPLIASIVVLIGIGGLAWLAVYRLRQTLAQARRSLVERNQFLGMMAHEMLTPLQTIISSVELIELEGRLPADHPTFRRLRRSAQQLEAQMNDTVEFARLSGGRLKVSPVLFQPDLMMQIIVAEYAPTANERGVELKVHIDPKPCPRVITDPARVRQIIANLVSNATKYANPGEVVCSMRAQESPAQITVTVMDQGPGLDTSLNLWAPFVRGSHVQSGSGLGLAVVKLMAELLGGNAQVVSRPGEGSAFIVRIPVKIEVVPGQWPAKPSMGRQKILVVDDNDDVRLGMQEMLLALGMVAEVAHSQTEAIVMLASTEYDGILLDLQLQDGHGYEVAKSARAPGALNQATPIVALSAYHEPNAESDALLAAKFEKPITVARLRSALQLFANSAAGHPSVRFVQQPLDLGNE